MYLYLLYLLTFLWRHRPLLLSLISRCTFPRPPLKRYMVTLGRRALILWSVIAATRCRRRAGAVAFISSLSSILRRQALKRWAAQAAIFAVDTERTMVALEHCYDGCLRAHLRAWSALTAERRLLRRGFELLLRSRLAGGMALSFRAWRRYVVRVRDIDLRHHRVRVSRPPFLGGRVNNCILLILCWSRKEGCLQGDGFHSSPCMA